jgi:GDPmannose 4,6-dehydratase
MKKKALITGITGQDGSYLAEFLLKKNYLVHGIIRKSSQFNTQRIDHIYENPFKNKKKLTLHYGDLTDPLSIQKIINKVKPNEIYNLAAQSHVKVSFDNPHLTSNVNAIGTLNILETIRSLKLFKTRFYHASSSEMFGKNFNICKRLSIMKF